MEGKEEPAPAISAVLEDDDLLGEILLCVAFPTSLVRAALVCKRWLRLASAPAFLQRFGGLHPPSLLGFYVNTSMEPPRFVALPQPPELDTVVRRASFDLDTLGCAWHRVDCWNGLLLLTSGMHCWGATPTHTRGVRWPLYPARYIAILPTVPDTSMHDGFKYFHCEILPNGAGSDGLSYFCLAIGCKDQQSVLDVYVLRENLWAIYSSAVTEINEIELLLTSLIVDDKIYNLIRVSGILKLVSLDLASSCLSLVNLPEEVDYMSTELSLANDSRVHLIHVKGSQLRIWHYIVDKKGPANWLLVDTICLREICVNHMISIRMFEDVGNSALIVHAVGVNPGFLFLETDGVLYLFDLERKAAKKVYEVTQE
ncbi:uncharacterized protein [Aegilops tauschii subsp. strangulata]|nr:uncharacterized protein LOC109743114 [Aegilops tauschii subsp. strangulata]